LVAVGCNRQRPVVTQRDHKASILRTRETDRDPQRPLFDRFDSRWRYQIRPDFAGLFLCV
jgi:hypothetical protein